MIDGVGYTNERQKVRKERVEGGDRSRWGGASEYNLKGVTTVGRTDREGNTLRLMVSGKENLEARRIQRGHPLRRPGERCQAI